MADFGIGETIAAVSAEAASKGAEAAGAAGAADVLAPVAAAGAGDAAGAFGTGAIADMAAAGVPGAIAPTVATGAGMGVGDLAAGTLASGLGPEALGMGGLASSALGASDVLGAGFSGTADALGTGAFQPQGAVAGGTADVWAAPQAGVAQAGTGPGAGAFSPAAGVSVPGATVPDATSAAAFGSTGDAGSALGVTPAASTPGGLPATGAATAGATPGGTSAVSGSSFLDKLGTGAINSITKNPLGVGAGVAGLGYSMMQGQKQSDAVKALTAQAGDLSGQGAQLRSYLSSGTLPPGLQASVDKAIADAKSHAISNAAAQGLPTDPTQNTALAQSLAAIDQQVPILTAQLGQQLMTTGVQESGLSSQLYTSLAGIDQAQTTAMGRAIANFAAAMSPGGTKIQIGGTSA